MTLLDQTHAIVVNWNGGEANLVCVQSLLDGGLPEARIQFVDNGSTDGSLESVTARFPGLAIQCNETNEGFGPCSSSTTTCEWMRPPWRT